MFSSLFFLRLAVGIIFMYHAAPKLQDPKKMAGQLGLLHGQVFALGLLEFLSAIALISGVAVKGAAFALILVMLGAIYHKIKKWNVPFMSANSTGWEFDFMLLAANITIYLK